MRTAGYLTLAALAAVACAESPGDAVPQPPEVTTLTCTDGARMRDLAQEYHRGSAEQAGDQAKILLSGQANFHASLAILAELQCGVTPPDADSAVTAVLAVGRAAAGAAPFYAQAQGWGRANFAALQAIALLAREPTPAPAP